ncbi:MAG: hypothetical protein Q8L54_05725 [Devosia sp.]|nr:hypothetical protein [Devosia sp.]
MAKTQASFREVDVRRAISGAVAAGLQVTRVEVDPSTGLIILATGTTDAAATAEPVDALDAWIRESGSAKA